MKIKVKDLDFSYGLKPILQISHISFEKGKAYGIVGKNGVGKTTFFKCLVNIITNYRGNVLINNLEVRNNLDVLGNVGIVLDDMNLYSNRSGMFNLQYFAGLRGGTLDRVHELASELDIANALNAKVSTYSLGMTKKLQLLISLMNNAEILIFDEPFRGLDAKTVEWFRNYLIELKEKGHTILISSHVQDDIEAISDYVYVLENGDFGQEFDLKDQTQEFIYTLEVSDRTKVKNILGTFNVTSKDVGDMVQFVTSADIYRDLFKQAVLADVEFLQVKKEVQFAKYVK